MTVREKKSDLRNDVDKTCDFIKSLADDLKADNVASMENIIQDVRNEDFSKDKAEDNLMNTVDLMARCDLITYLRNAVTAVLEKYTTYKSEEE